MFQLFIVFLESQDNHFSVFFPFGEAERNVLMLYIIVIES